MFRLRKSFIFLFDCRGFSHQHNRRFKKNSRKWEILQAVLYRGGDTITTIIHQQHHHRGQHKHHRRLHIPKSMETIMYLLALHLTLLPHTLTLTLTSLSTISIQATIYHNLCQLPAITIVFLVVCTLVELLPFRLARLLSTKRR